MTFQTCNHFAVPAILESTQRPLTIARHFVGRPHKKVRKAASEERWESRHCRQARTRLPPDQSSCDHWLPPIVRRVVASVQAHLWTRKVGKPHATPQRSPAVRHGPGLHPASLPRGNPSAHFPPGGCP